MAPIVDGPYSIEVYFSCLDSCQRQLGERVGYSNMIESHDYIVYHLGGVASEESKSGAGRPAQNEEWFVYRWSR